MEASVKKIMVLLVILPFVVYYLLDRFVLWMQEFEIPRDWDR